MTCSTPDLDLEADLGVDTVKQAEVFAAVREQFGIPRDENLKLRDFPTLAHVVRFARDRAPGATTPRCRGSPGSGSAPAAQAAPAAAARAGTGRRSLLLPHRRDGRTPASARAAADRHPLVGRRTSRAAERGSPSPADAGRPASDDRLPGPTMLRRWTWTCEADLGVDTVKQAEVFAAVREQFDIPRDENLKLRDFPTLAHVIRFVRDRAPSAATCPGTRQPPAAAAPAPQLRAGTAGSAACARPAGPPRAGTARSPTDEVRRGSCDRSELTGYPPDLLDLDLDMEADLGVDTVKQAEVFAAVREQFDIPRDENLKLRDFPTLAHVIGFVRDRAPEVPQRPAAAHGTERRPPRRGPRTLATAAPTFTGDVAAADRLPRRVPAPCSGPRRVAPYDRRDSGPRQPGSSSWPTKAGWPKHWSSGWVHSAYPHWCWRRAARTPTSSPGLPPGSARVLCRACTGLRRWTPSRRLPISTSRAGGKNCRRRVKSLYTVVRHLDTSGQLGPRGTFLVAATRLGGYHGYDEAGAVAPLGGAVTGFVKAYRRERPDVLAKAVDFPVSRKTAALADMLVEETLRDPGAVEIGRADGRRWAVGLREEPFGDGTGGMALGKQTVFAVTGAAGIVLAIVADLAKASGGVFHLLDLTPEPDPSDQDLIAFATDRDRLKAEIAERLAAGGKRPTPCSSSGRSPGTSACTRR